jgi:hypothetical protein
MRDIQPLGDQNHGALVPEDVTRALTGLAGTYAAADLYARYADAAKEAGNVPAHPVAFGQELARRGCVRRTVFDKRKGHRVKGWGV